MIIKVTKLLVIDHRAREWCKLPYPDHPRGCPNYGKKEGCPPQAPLIGDYFDLTKAHYFVVVQFDLRAHISRMKSLHPDWSDRQARCVLYWQGGVNKQLKEQCQSWVAGLPGFLYTLCPEAMGIDVIRTCQLAGLPIEPLPIDTVFKVGMLGVRR